ncbi:putrescine ABC transporter permease PotH [Pararhodobacter oceanensis]|uniref:Putrescine ABC transporter permease PotH n=2 Tax=Pararhodobacter oceanensis TaxID=2172121 RepID=A0A2T8HWE0_9RHOB|nr:putrescine ABC transporter permease PotH [Pararhodobacter oceanensis]
MSAPDAVPSASHAPLYRRLFLIAVVALALALRFDLLTLEAQTAGTLTLILWTTALALIALEASDALGISRRWLVIALPMLWLFVFFLVPFLVLGRISIAESMIARPPYSPLWERGSDGSLEIIASLDNYRFLLSDALYRNAYLSSFRVAAISTIFALLIGYPLAYYIARAPEPRRSILLLLVILPFWTSFLLRVYAWIGFLRRDGVINNILTWAGVIDEPLVMMQTDLAVYIGIVYTYLPFMILPLYANLVKLDGALLEAAGDLGASPMVTFLTITLPLSLPGIVAGSMLVFIPAIGEYVIPALLGGPDTLMIGRVLWDEFFASRDWPVASAVAIVMLVLVVLPIMWLQSVQNREVPK